MLDELTQAVLARDEVARYLRADADGHSDPEARDRIFAYLEELRTTQRYPIFRALKHPLYPILRKVDRHVEGIAHVQAAGSAGRVIYASNHRSHIDYLVEALALIDNGIRPPITAAGINLFGGPLGLLHRHVTGAIPIRRNSKDPAYLITLKAYVAELLQRHDLFFYPEGGRSYSGEIKSFKTGLLHAALLADCPDLYLVPVGIAYDLVLEDYVLARQGVKGRQRAFAREIAEMVRYAVGYESRSFVTFGKPIPLAGYDASQRRDVMALAHLTRDAMGKLIKVLPTSLVATAMRPSMTRRELEERVGELIEALSASGANLGVASAHEAVERGVELLANRNVIVVERGRLRIRERTVLRYYARSIQHLLSGSSRAVRTH